MNEKTTVRTRCADAIRQLATMYGLTVKQMSAKCGWCETLLGVYRVNDDMSIRNLTWLADSMDANMTIAFSPKSAPGVSCEVSVTYRGVPGALDGATDRTAALSAELLRHMIPHKEINAIRKAFGKCQTTWAGYWSEGKMMLSTMQGILDGTFRDAPKGGPVSFRIMFAPNEDPDGDKTVTGGLAKAMRTPGVPEIPIELATALLGMEDIESVNDLSKHTKTYYNLYPGIGRRSYITLCELMKVWGVEFKEDHPGPKKSQK